MPAAGLVVVLVALLPRSVNLDIEVHRPLERPSEPDIVPPPAFERVWLILCGWIDGFQGGMEDSSHRVMPGHRLPWSGKVNLVMAQGVRF